MTLGPSSNIKNVSYLQQLGNIEVVHERWTAAYGDTIKYRELLGLTRLYTTDLKAITHVLMHSNDYQKPEFAVYNLRRLLGEGVLLVEGDVHRQQRKILNPAFGIPQLRLLTEIFVEKSVELRDNWVSEIQKQSNNGEAKVDAMSWLNRMTLDVIGRAGFNYDFQGLSKDSSNNELSQAFDVIFKIGLNFEAIIPLLRSLVPMLRIMPAPHDSEVNKAKDTVFRIGRKLLQESKNNVHEKTRADKDLLSLMTRANMDPDVPANQRMTDDEVISQIPTFLFAGHETTSTATSWALYALSQNKEVQSKLREELLAVSTDNPTMDELNELHYLDNVIKETLRLYAPLPGTLRVAMKDDFLPLSKPFKDRKGVLRNEIRVLKGQTITIPILSINRAESLWGQDAREFNPDRWDNLPEAVSAIPGVGGHYLSFLAGSRACIGYRFSLVEMKALLFTLIRAFEIDLAVPPNDIQRKLGLVQRPYLTTDPTNPNQLPIAIRPVFQN
ncbi:cytochrome P450 [Agrocybe pediades]|nr:cytochrome P450 [Agrocybe pediades]